MRKNLKKFTALILSSIMALSLAACGGTNTPDDAADPEAVQETTDTGSTDDAAATNNGEVVTLKWIAVGSGMPSNYDDWIAVVNTYLEEKIGVNLEMEIVSWGDWDNRRSVIVNTNEPYDILFTNAQTFTSDVRLGAFLDITDMVKTVTPDLYSYIPEEYWQAAGINGQIYSIPTYKDSSRSEYFVWDKALADSYDIDYENMHSLSDISDALKLLAEEEGSPSHILDYKGEDAIDKDYDFMGAGLRTLGVRYDDETRTVVSIYEQEDVMNDLKLLHDWYNSGVINKDAATLQEHPAYRMNYVAQGWPSAAITNWSLKIGVEAIAVQWGDTIVSNDSVRGSLNCISSSSQNPEKALQFLELVNLDSWLRDSLYFGLEGTDWDYTEDGLLHRHNTDWTMAGYTQGTFFTVTQTDDEEFNQWDEVKELNENAEPSVLLGFDFDYSAYENEVANCAEIFNRYKGELRSGATEPEATVAAMMNEMRTAGYDILMEEAQKQIDEAFK